MSLEHVLLGLLREPASGYDLKAVFDETARHFWHAELSQIYPTLKRLEGRGLLESRTEPSDRGPERRVYRITREGREELRHWLREGPTVGRQRLEYVAQVFFLGELEDEDVRRGFLEQLEAELRARAATYDAIHAAVMADLDGPEPVDDDHPWMYLTLRLGQRVTAARLAWVDEVKSVLDSTAGD